MRVMRVIGRRRGSNSAVFNLLTPDAHTCILQRSAARVQRRPASNATRSWRSPFPPLRPLYSLMTAKPSLYNRAKAGKMLPRCVAPCLRSQYSLFFFLEMWAGQERLPVFHGAWHFRPARRRRLGSAKAWRESRKASLFPTWALASISASPSSACMFGRALRLPV